MCKSHFPLRINIPWIWKTQLLQSVSTESLFPDKFLQAEQQILTLQWAGLVFKGLLVPAQRRVAYQQTFVPLVLMNQENFFSWGHNLTSPLPHLLYSLPSLLVVAGGADNTVFSRAALPPRGSNANACDSPWGACVPFPWRPARFRCHQRPDLDGV